VPYVIRPHGTLDPYIRRRHRFLKKLYHGVAEDSTLRHAAAIHFTSNEECQLASPVLPAGVETCVVPHGIDLRGFESLATRSEARAALGIGDDQTVWLFLGRLNHKKGLDLLAPAFVEFSKRVPESFLIVAGPDDDGLMPGFLEECRRGGVRDSVRYTGFLDRAQMKQVLAAADFWILPSYSENFGVAVIEAMAARLPVLVTDKVNIWRQVQDYRAGVVTHAKTESVLEGMHRLAQLSHEERAEMGNRGRELCRTSFSWEKAAHALSALYAKIAPG
jgi:glycosyltransferase involved in cell wall biosynthesis